MSQLIDQQPVKFWSDVINLKRVFQSEMPIRPIEKTWWRQFNEKRMSCKACKIWMWWICPSVGKKHRTSEWAIKWSWLMKGEIMHHSMSWKSLQWKKTKKRNIKRKNKKAGAWGAMVEWLEHLSLDQVGLSSIPVHSNYFSLLANKLVLGEITKKLLI